MPQTGKNLVIAYKVEATLNTAPGATGAEELRLTNSPGLSPNKDAIRSNEIRSDGLSTIPRHGSRSVSGSFNGELSPASWNTILAAVARATLTAAATTTEATASLASISFGTNTVDATSTSTGSGFLGAGIRVGDVFRVSGTGGSNDNINAQVVAVATHTITTNAGAFTADASAVTSFSLTRGTKIVNGTTLVRKSYYIDQYYQDNDLSEAYGGCRFTSFSLTGSPNGMAEISVGALGMSFTALASGASPYYTSPTQYTNDPLVFADAVLRFNGSELAVATAFSLNYENTAQVLPVIGTDVTPDVFDNDSRLTGSLSLNPADLSNLTAFDAETEIELFVFLQDPEAAPKGYVGIFVPKLKLMGLDHPLGSDGAFIETVPWEAGVVTSSAGYDQTLITLTIDT